MSPCSLVKSTLCSKPIRQFEFMTKDQIRIAVAELCGAEWRLTPRNGNLHTPNKRRRFLVFPKLYGLDGTCDLETATGAEGLMCMEYIWREGCIPNYPENLDACAEMEATLDVGIDDNNSPRYEYSRIVYSICHPFTQPFRASALIRCEAFLRLHGKWVEKPQHVTLNPE